MSDSDVVELAGDVCSIAGVQAVAVCSVFGDHTPTAVALNSQKFGPQAAVTAEFSFMRIQISSRPPDGGVRQSQESQKHRNRS